MILRINDWEFDIDAGKTREHASFALSSHCICGYCVNFYESVEQVYPGLREFLERFCLEIQGPSEMYPIEPTLCLVAYKVWGHILRVGTGPIMVDGLPVIPEILQEGLFKLEIGEIPLPWILDEDMDEVISPANEPEFLERMYDKLRRRYGGGFPLLS